MATQTPSISSVFGPHWPVRGTVEGTFVGLKEGAADWILEGAIVRRDGIEVGLCDGSPVGHCVGYWVVGADDEEIGCNVGR